MNWQPETGNGELARSACIYLDYNASAPLRPEARAAWLAAQEQAFANPAARHRPGQAARHQLDQAKKQLAGLLGCRASELICVSGGSEAIALAVHAAVAGLGIGWLLPSAIEHSAVLRSCEQQAACTQLLPVDSDGRVRVDELERLLPREQPALVCIQFANNELGVVQDIPALVAAVRALRADHRVLLDCCQGAGKAAIDLHALDVDYAVVSGHKFGAPVGCGLLYLRQGLPCPALIRGGTQQQDRRSGTEDVAAAGAMAAALEAALRDLDGDTERLRSALAAALVHIRQQLPELRVLAEAAPRLPGVAMLAYPDIDAGRLQLRLDLAGIAVGTGSACQSVQGARSHVIAALGLPEALSGGIRVSAGWATAAEELDRFASAYVAEVRHLKAIGSSSLLGRIRP